jgi:hypothetical protein
LTAGFDGGPSPPSVFGLNSLFSSFVKSSYLERALVGLKLGLCHSATPDVVIWGFRRLEARSLGLGLAVGGACAASACSSAGSLMMPCSELLGTGLAVHVGDQVGELLPGLEQLA